MRGADQLVTEQEIQVQAPHKNWENLEQFLLTETVLLHC